MSNNNIPQEEDDRWADHHFNSLIDKAKESEVQAYHKLVDNYDSLVDHCRDLDSQLKNKEKEIKNLRNGEIDFLNSIAPRVYSCLSREQYDSLVKRRKLLRSRSCE
jgi:hypothetical protein